MLNGTVCFFAGAEEIKDSTHDRTASPASKAFNESHSHRLRHPRHLMSLALPTNPSRNSKMMKLISVLDEQAHSTIQVTLCLQMPYTFGAILAISLC